jgi:hypothetical protein
MWSFSAASYSSHALCGKRKLPALPAVDFRPVATATLPAIGGDFVEDLTKSYGGGPLRPLGSQLDYHLRGAEYVML